MNLVEGARDAVDEALTRLVFSGALDSTHRWAARIEDAQVETAITIIDSTGICERPAIWRCEDRKRESKAPGGPPATLNDRAVLVLLVVLALEHSPTTR
ncbi:MAG: hypothetical protein ACYDEP_07805 [Acidimicrobiales bacterium]